MGKNQANTPKTNAGTIVTQKTNEDYNKKKPDPTDPNEVKGKPDTAVPDFGDQPLAPMKDKATEDSVDKKKMPNKSDGSE